MTLPEPRLAGIIDIGSNSVRLVICEILGASILQTFNEKVMAGLGEGLAATGCLSTRGVEAALHALARYRAIMLGLNVGTWQAVATAAVRVARDGDSFLQQAAAILGRPVRLLSGPDEARLSARGVELSIHDPEGLIGDLGGSSLELKPIGRGAGETEGESLMLGPLALSDILNDPREVRRRVRDGLRSGMVLSGVQGQFYAVGGAWRSFGRLVMEMEDYPLRVLQGFRLNEGQIARAARLCIDSLSSSSARVQIEAVDKKRARHLPVAAILMEEILSVTPLESVIISAAGVREGVLHELLEMPVQDPLGDGIVAYTRLEPGQIAFGQALHEFIAPALHPQIDLFGSPSADTRIEKAACLMADSAGRFHPDHRAEMAYDHALRAPYLGVTHAERAMIAHAVGCRYDKDFRRPPEHTALTTDIQSERARQIGLLMRLGAVFSGRSGSILQRARLSLSQGLLVMEVAAKDSELVSETVRRRLSQAAGALRMKSDIRIC